MTRWLTSSWVAALAGCLVYLGTTALLIRPAQFAGLREMLSAATMTPDNDPSWKFKNPEFDQWVAELKLEKSDLDARTQQLQELQTRLEAERQEFSVETQTVYQLQSEFDRNVTRLKAQEMTNLKQQAKVIASMSPDGAANMMNQMAEDDVVRLLAVMKPDEASPVLDAMSKQGFAGARYAAELTSRLRLVLPDPTGAVKSAP